ncbi:preprotein translocase, SecG subunit [Beggiatoa sp. PS]|nr:preprotein translocase, SecG subunit [Beggiatoa sp. PS]
MIFDILVIFHVILSLALIGLILIQHGKGADAGAAFGSGASATVFGSQGSGSFLTRTTGVLATLFFVTSLTLAYFTIQRIEPKSVLESSVVTQQPAPTTESEVPVTEKTDSELPPVENNETSTIPATETENPVPSE